MTEEILINHTSFELRAALIQEGAVREVLIDRPKKQGLVGNIYLGKVTRALSGMQAAFVDIGERRAAFLSVDDIPLINHDASDRRLPPIQNRLRQGEWIVAQVIKEPLGNKGARLSMDISVTSRYLVYAPKSARRIGVSAKIKDKNAKKRLHALLQNHLQDARTAGSLVARSAAASVDLQILQNDLRSLQRLWDDILRRKRTLAPLKKPALLYQEPSLFLRIFRDLASENTQKIWVDDRSVCAQLRDFAREFAPHFVDRVAYYTANAPLFEAYGVEKALQSALERRVDLPSGGYLIVDRTEAMTVIDVNTGSFVGKTSLEDTVYQTNKEAAIAIARQLRLRNVGGIVVVDFIDMAKADRREDLLAVLKEELHKDRATTKIAQVSALGLVEITRQRVYESLLHRLCEPCAVCQGRGYQKSSQSVCFEIFRAVARLGNAPAASIPKTIAVVASAKIVDRLRAEEAETLADLQNLLESSIVLQIQASYTQEQYAILTR